MTGAAGARYVVRDGHVRGAGMYRSRPPFHPACAVQKTAIRMSRIEADVVANMCGGRVVRLVSRAEAVARAERKAHEAGMLAGIRWAHAEADKIGAPCSMLAAMCPCQSEVADPGDHVGECPWSDPDYDDEKETGR